MNGRAAVVGGGVAGLVAAHELSKFGWTVTLFEKNAYVGGHTNTVVLEGGPDAGAGVDTGFIVLNDRTYPLFHRFLAELGVPWRWSDMSFGYFDENTGLQYAGTDAAALLARPGNMFSPALWKVLFGFARLSRKAPSDLADGALAAMTLGEYMNREGYSAEFRDHFLYPMAAAIWSAGLTYIEDFPAEALMHFFLNHGLLSLNDRPRWQTVVGGSHSYVKAFLSRFRGTVRRGAGVERIRRLSGGVEIAVRGSAPEMFDRVVIAAHADEALAMLTDPTEDETRLLGAWRYHRNRTLLHTDESFLPPAPRARASWNYRRERGEVGARGVSVTYDMNRLQGLRSLRRYLVTLNPRREPAPGAVVREFSYLHPAYTFSSLRTQKELLGLNGVRSTWYCGSYFGSGFHEDAVASAINAVRHFLAAPQEVA